MLRHLFITLLALIIVSCGGSRDFTRGDESDDNNNPFGDLRPDLFILFSKNSESIDLTLRQVSEDFSEVLFSRIRVNTVSNRVSFENESVGELSCQSVSTATECELVFFSGIIGNFALNFQEDYDFQVIFELVEAYSFDDAPPIFSAQVCDFAYGPIVPGEKTTIRVVDKNTSETVVTFLFYDFGFQNQGQLSSMGGAENTSLYYGVNFDPFFSGVPYSYTGSRKTFSNDDTFLEIQAIQTAPSFKRTLVCFNDQ